MIDLPPRRYAPVAHTGPMMRQFAIAGFIFAALFATSALRADSVERIFGVVAAAFFVGVSLYALWTAQRVASYGFEHGAYGFRNPKPKENAEWRPWSAVETVRVRRGEVVLLDDAGRRLAGFSIMLEGFQDALDDVLTACPHAVPAASLPATFSGRSSRRVGIVETVIDPAGITIRTRQDERRIEREAIRDVRVVWGDPHWRERRARQRWWERRERREPGYRVVVQDRAATLVTIAPPSVDAVAVYAAVKAMRAGNGDRE